MAAYDYDSYGRVISELALIAQPFRYTGREWDESAQLYHYRARGYDPSTGRFVQEDPIGFAAGDLNIYRYVGSNPLTYVDPSGMAAAISHAQLRSRAMKTGSATAAVGLGLACLFNSIADGVELAGEPGLTELNLLACTAEAAIGAVGGAVIGRGIAIGLRRAVPAGTKIIKRTFRIQWDPFTKGLRHGYMDANLSQINAAFRKAGYEMRTHSNGVKTWWRNGIKQFGTRPTSTSTGLPTLDVYNTRGNIVAEIRLNP